LSSVQEIIERASASPSISKIVSALASGRRNVSVSRMSGSALPLASAIVQRSLERPVLLVVSDEDEAYAHYQDLASLTDAAFNLPSRREEIEPSIETVEQRISALYGALSNRTPAIVASLKAILQPVVSPGEFLPLTKIVSQGDEADRDRLMQALSDSGFERVSAVEDVGEMAVRGGLIDIFPYDAENPFRIEFSGDTIESIREFDPLTQRSVSTLSRIRLLPFREPIPRDDKDKTFVSFSEYLKSDSIIFFDESWSLVSQMEDSTDEHCDPSFLDKLKSSCQSVEISAQAEFSVPIRPQMPYERNLNLLREDLKGLERQGYTTFVLCESEGQQRRMSEILSETSAGVIVGSLSSGFLLDDASLAVFTEKDIFGREPARRRRKFKGGLPIESVLTLSPGDIVVHTDYGIARFEGIERVRIQDAESDCLLLRYDGGDKIYVPTENMHMVQRYVGPTDIPPALTKLGTKSWEKSKQKAKKAVLDMTRELLAVYAARKAMKGFAFPRDVPWQSELEASFDYDETEDQLKTIAEIKKDMESERPMDRLICGEVGYGKTEVALRAAFKAVMAGRQVALLAPTTILAQQHHNTFGKRLKPFPVRYEVISRFKTSKEQKEILQDLKDGKIDIIIGTHRLLSNDVVFKDLGLLIVDEEHRFGVRHKEKIKKMRNLVDVLTMSATPIPRTLYMSLVGVRDMSTIDTAPSGRLSINTEVAAWDDDCITEYIQREIDRGGQVYFVHNRVQTIDSVASYLHNVLPHLRMGIAHGQMHERHLESIMVDFLNGCYDVLVTSAIIESGVDIPNVNTMVINRGDKFGLAQLHQLRGRVGRSNRRAYCLILIPKGKRITREARKRLSAILSHTELGSGYKLAMRDLEIRGAGNLLGSEQHGHIQSVGYDLYCQLVADAVAEMKGEVPHVEVTTSVSLDSNAFIPDSYIPDGEHKIALYKRLVTISNEKKLAEIREELIDRFGPVPEPCESLLHGVEVRILASKLGIRRVAVSERWAEISFDKSFEPSQVKLEKALKDWPAPVEFATSRGLKVKVALGSLGPERFKVLKNLLHLLE
jgi:transcription-repair coupling factor (superfamily II helicase)